VPLKPPLPAAQPPRAPAPHVHAAVARAAQAKMPERQPLPRPLQAKPEPLSPGRPLAPHVLRANDSVQAKLAKPLPVPQRPAPRFQPPPRAGIQRTPVRATPPPRPGVHAVQAKIITPNTTFNDFHLMTTDEQKSDAIQGMLAWYSDEVHKLNGTNQSFVKHVDHFLEETMGSAPAIRVQALKLRWLGLGVTEANDPVEGLKYLQEITVILNDWEAAQAKGGHQAYAKKLSLDDDLGVSGRDKAMAAYTRHYAGAETKSHAHHGANFVGGTKRIDVLRNMLDGVHSSKGPTVLAAIVKDFPKFTYTGSYRG